MEEAGVVVDFQLALDRSTGKSGRFDVGFHVDALVWLMIGVSGDV